MTMPLLLSVPHAGLKVPQEVREICLLTAQEIADDSDSGAAEIYDLAADVKGFVTSDIARAIVDLNRAEDDFRQDGVIKTHTCWGVPVYSKPPSPELVELLLERYHRPFHRTLRHVPKDVHLGIDCHTMAATAPAVAPDPGERRPAVCLSNGNGKTCPNAWLSALQECLAEHFDEVLLNTPFRGGHIVRSHAEEIPWVQLELSRDPSRSFNEKRAGVFAALLRFCEDKLPLLLDAPLVC